MAVIEVQHVLCLMCHVKPKPFTNADVPGLPELAVQTLLDAAGALLPFSRKLRERQGAKARNQGQGNTQEHSKRNTKRDKVQR